MTYPGKKPDFDEATLDDLSSAPANPPSGKVKIYAKDGKFFLINSSGVETEVGSGAGLGEAPTDGKLYARDGQSADWVAINVLPPTIVQPQDGATGLKNPTPLLEWRYNSPAGENQVNADIEVATDSGFSTIIWSSLDDTSNLTSIQIPGGTLSDSTQYWWRVRTSGDITGDSEYSSATFTTGVLADTFDKTASVTTSYSFTSNQNINHMTPLSDGKVFFSDYRGAGSAQPTEGSLLASDGTSFAWSKSWTDPAVSYVEYSGRYGVLEDTNNLYMFGSTGVPTANALRSSIIAVSKSTGVRQWSRYDSWSNTTSEFYHGAVCSGGDIAVFGRASNSGVASYTMGAILKISSTGTTSWYRTYYQGASFNAQAGAETTNGTYLVMGGLWSNGSVNRFGLVAVLSVNGGFNAGRRYYVDASASFADVYDIQPNSQDVNNVIACGYGYKTGDGSFGIIMDFAADSGSNENHIMIKAQNAAEFNYCYRIAQDSTHIYAVIDASGSSLDFVVAINRSTFSIDWAMRLTASSTIKDLTVDSNSVVLAIYDTTASRNTVAIATLSKSTGAVTSIVGRNFTNSTIPYQIEAVADGDYVIYGRESAAQAKPVVIKNPQSNGDWSDISATLTLESFTPYSEQTLNVEGVTASSSTPSATSYSLTEANTGYTPSDLT